MNPIISVIIPNYNGEKTLRHCLDAVYDSDYDQMEVIVVDDCSQDRSVEIIKQFPCRLVQLPVHCGASAARNAGVRAARGTLLFFTDSDCLLQSNTLTEVSQVLLIHGPKSIIGGTYRPQSFDNEFYSRFQSVLINYSETKCLTSPDYIATHAMAIYKDTFINGGGFKEQWLPILEDVEFSHRLRSMGCRLIVHPTVLVQHIFNFSLSKSFRNAARKSHYWIQYSIANNDLLSDSGTASHEFKFNVAIFHASLVCMALSPFYSLLFVPILLTCVMANLWLNQGLLTAFYNAYGTRFSLAAMIYYFFAYPIPVTIGGVLGVTSYLRSRTTVRAEI